ncbi:hypothetical protein SDC9_94855 [bioreactor metagenome]|uniref:Uncharacterized protein n=1 Tax=bioreactor metagenome TaxID=1076179 RepID=A0A645ABC1_9ZZZZ
MGGQKQLAHGPVHRLELHPLVGFDGDGVFPVGAEYLHLGPLGRKLPARQTAVFIKGFLILCGTVVEGGSIMKISHGVGELLGRSLAVNPVIVVHFTKLPALQGHALQVPLDAGVIIELEQLHPALNVPQVRPLLPNGHAAGNPPTGLQGAHTPPPGPAGLSG